MKNIQDIIKEMEKISEQVATTVNSDDTPLTPENAEEELSTIINNAPAAVGDPVIGTAFGIVPVSNTFTIPTVSEDDPTVPAINLTLMYTTVNLVCTVNPILVSCTLPDCPTGVIEVNAYEVRLVGSIPYIVGLNNINGPVQIPPVTFEGVPGMTPLAYSSSFQVNKRLGVYPTLEAANAIANTPGILSITNITSTYTAQKLAVSGGEGQAVEFTITFNSVIGNCP